MKGIILAGGKGTRLFPNTRISSKQLLPVYDKPMIYYPLSTLLLGGVNEIALISTVEDLPLYKELLGNGDGLGITITYFEQPEPNGLAEAFLICEDFIGDDKVALILGDNIFYGNMRLDELFSNFKEGALVFAYKVKDPEKYGVIEFDKDGKILDIKEKPQIPKSNFIIPGLYLYDNKVVEYTKDLKPSERGELEITDLNRTYLKKHSLSAQVLGRGISWIDVGEPETLQEASNFVSYIEKRQSYKIACIEEICLRRGFISLANFRVILDSIPECSYKDYLSEIADEFVKESITVNKLQP